MIAAAWAEQKAIKEVMIFLQGVGVSTSLAVRIYKKYGDARSPSCARAVPAGRRRVGDRVQDRRHHRRSVGIAPDSPERIKAGLAYTLSEAADDGHCYLPAPNLITDAAKILDVPADLIAPCLDELAAAEGCPRTGARGGPARARRGRTAGPRRLPAALLSGRTVPGPRPPPPARRPPTAWPGSPPSTGTRPSAGCAAGPVRSSPRNRPTRSGSR
jgi:ATP-dependent exoDNAse (exonuclease V), alpha subunit - helicase superfamily I member